MSDIQVIDINSVTPHPDNPRRGNVAAIKKSLVQFGQVTPIVVQASTMHVVKGNHTRLAALQLGWTQIQAIIMEMDDATARDYLIVDNRTSDLAGYNEKPLHDLLLGGLLTDENGFTEEDRASIMAGGQPSVNGFGHEPAPATQELSLTLEAHERERLMDGIETLQIKYGTRSIADTIQRAVDEARAAASNEAELGAPLQAKADSDEAEDEAEALQDWWDWRAAWQGMPEYRNENRKQWRTLYVHFAGSEDMQSFSQLVGQPLTDRTRFIWYPESEILEVMGKLRWVEAEQ